jgi:hypothetical protein
MPVLVGSRQQFSFGGANFLYLVIKKKSSLIHIKDFGGKKKGAKIARFQRKKNSAIAIFRQLVLYQLAKNIAGFEKYTNFLSHLKPNLAIPLVDDDK